MYVCNNIKYIYVYIIAFIGSVFQSCVAFAQIWQTVFHWSAN